MNSYGPRTLLVGCMLIVCGRATAQIPEAPHPQLPYWYETTERAHCDQGNILLTTRSSPAGVEVLRFQAPGINSRTIKRGLQAELADLKALSAVRISCANQSYYLWITGYRQWSGETSKVVTRRFVVAGRYITRFGD